MSNLWIFTPDGFFSSRQDEWCEDDEVMVRSRIYEDLLALADLIGMDNPEIIRIPHGDYLYRMKIKQTDWNIYCAHAAMNHSADGGIKDTEDTERFFAYLRIWEIMQGLQKLKDAEKRGNKKEIESRREIFYEMVWPEYDHPDYRKKMMEKSTYKHGMWMEGMKPKTKKKKKRRNKKRKARYVDDFDMSEFDTSSKVSLQHNKDCELGDNWKDCPACTFLYDQYDYKDI